THAHRGTWIRILRARMENGRQYAGPGAGEPIASGPRSATEMNLGCRRGGRNGKNTSGNGPRAHGYTDAATLMGPAPVSQPFHDRAPEHDERDQPSEQEHRDHHLHDA